MRIICRIAVVLAVGFAAASPGFAAKMGHEFVPLATRADADDFLKDHKGRAVVPFADVTPRLVERVDSGKP